MPKVAVFTELKRQTTTVRYSVAILCFGGSFSVMGPFVYCLATQAHGQLPEEISTKLCCRWTSNEVQSWTFSHTNEIYVLF